MKNITVSVPDDIYSTARRQAADRNTSVSQLVAEYLRSLGREDELRAERAVKLEEVFTMKHGRPQPGPVGQLNRNEIYDAEIR
jgi:hypothetical protein